MKMYSPLGLLAVFALNLSLLPIMAQAEENKVSRIVVVKVTDGSVDNYAEMIAKKGVPIIKRLNPDVQVRVWQATYAGDDTGPVVVAVEFPSLSAFAESTEKLAADRDWRRFLAELGEIRKIVSDSLYKEITK